MQESERVVAVRIDDGVHVHLANAFELADVEGVLREQFTRAAGFNVALAKARILLLDKGDLLAGNLNRPLGLTAFQREPPLVA